MDGEPKAGRRWQWSLGMMMIAILAAALGLTAILYTREVQRNRVLAEHYRAMAEQERYRAEVALAQALLAEAQAREAAAALERAKQAAPPNPAPAP